ncbi:AAA family ATPase [Azohydromonas australica]|uniref:AAA family ATPase n=1 Tax=Azohydromonas australica TaxID=364039 RepID=UPI00040B7BE7|nr:AAA family ATPase [Azohydromonas australica]
MGFLKIMKMEYLGDKYYFESPSLNQNICIIEGPNGSGKSTFFNLIYFCLGGKVAEFDPESNEVHDEVMSDTNNMARLIIQIDGRLYTLTRKIRENLITVFEGRTSADGIETEVSAFTLPVYRKESGQRAFSDWMLEELGIPVVEIFQGGRSFKLNFTDLSRLFYHNQSPDPHGIYKPADNVNFITDSLEIRRAIFQILVGKTLLALYDAISQMKIADKEQQAARSVHQEYQDIVSELLKASGVQGVQNVKSLRAQIELLEAQLSKLLDTRSGFTKGRVGESAARKMLDIQLRDLHELEIAGRSIEKQIAEVSEEAGRMIDLERMLKDDIERINKVIYTHGQLALFSSDTCPFCLNTVNRAKYKCVCGHDVDEHDYQRFFYSSAEYLDILRSKSKALETLALAVIDIRDEKKSLTAERERLEQLVADRRKQLEGSIGNGEVVSAAVDQVDEKILESRTTISRLQEALRLEEKLATLQERLDSKKRQYEIAKAEVNRLDAASKVELQGQLTAFNAVYNDMMTSVLADCRTAQIDSETYLPVINNGVYREASATVPKRFLYYLTLLQLSLQSDIPFPRLLLVDTPETAGIDLPNLVKMLRLVEALENPKNKEYQFIMSTGVGKFPAEFESFVVLRLSDDAKLLHRRSASS